MNECRVIKTEVTDHGVVITLANGVELRVSSNPGYFHFSLSGIEVPTHWGVTPDVGSDSSNIQNCYYQKR